MVGTCKEAFPEKEALREYFDCPAYKSSEAAVAGSVPILVRIDTDEYACHSYEATRTNRRKGVYRVNSEKLQSWEQSRTSKRNVYFHFERELTVLLLWQLCAALASLAPPDGDTCRKHVRVAAAALAAAARLDTRYRTSRPALWLALQELMKSLFEGEGENEYRLCRFISR